GEHLRRLLVQEIRHPVVGLLDGLVDLGDLGGGGPEPRDQLVPQKVPHPLERRVGRLLDRFLELLEVRLQYLDRHDYSPWVVGGSEPVGRGNSCPSRLQVMRLERSMSRSAASAAVSETSAADTLGTSTHVATLSTHPLA